MGLLRNGTWHDQWYDTDASDGEFEREQARFRNWITPDGSAGPTGKDGFEASPERYHLFVSLACPWAHRTLIFRQLKGLTALVSASTVHPHMLNQGWEFSPDERFSDPQITLGDPLYQSDFLHQLYTRAAPDYSGRVTVPVLWDRHQQTIVSNESADIIRMFNHAFDHLTGNRVNMIPAQLLPAIDRLNAFIYPWINNGVYRCGFATRQKAYEKAYRRLFRALDWLESRLTEQRFLTGRQITEADWRLFTTLIRFDAVYHGHFKCNLRPIRDYQALQGYLRDLYQQPGITATVNFAHIKAHYYASHRSINPTGIVPAGPLLELDEPHGREAL
ncbi:glutathione S-transferase family protein [Motiliproteus sediminis]|uniref:glutathione S-transferase family protein n=1 Tax=Motiliproteus sediminis TaxID=1468178 RepID=UPI001AF00FA8|nr:glutathione S-transferase family protein [Motiliproteus sediminis]